MAFRQEAITIEDGTPWGRVAEPWQLEDFAALDSGKYRHAYIERPRGHAKTFDIGTEAVKELILGRPGQRLYCAAADEDQARLLFDDAREKFERNPLLRNSVKILSREITVPATGSRLRVLAGDAPSAYGLRPDWIAVDELAEWTKRALWDSLWTATGKRPSCRMLVISTAGWDRTSVAWEVRQHAEKETDWYFRSREQCASWIDSRWLQQQERTLPRHVFARLHLNQWVEGVGAWLSYHEVDRIFSNVDIPMIGDVVIGLDLGVAHDRTVASVLRRAGDVIFVDALHAWEGSGAHRISLSEVEEAIEELIRRHSAPLVADPWQALLMIERLRRKGFRVVDFNFSAENRRKLFSVMLDLVRTGRLKSRPHDELRRELLGLEVQERASGYRVDHRPGRHDDFVMAVGLAAQHLASRPDQGGSAITWIDGWSEAPRSGWRALTPEEFALLSGVQSD
jgi:hypothetical protein